MKTVLLVTAALFGWAVYAHAAEGYSDPSDLRTPGVTVSASAVTIKPAEGGMNLADPYGMRTPGVTASASTATIKPADGGMNLADPYGMRMPGVAFVNPSAQLASQPAHRTQPIVHAHAPTVTNANPNNG